MVEGQVKQSQRATFTAQNSVSGEAVQVDHQGESFAASAQQPQKWSFS